MRIKIFIILLVIASMTKVTGCRNMSEAQDSFPEEMKLSKEELLDKIKGGWAGQTIGVTYGGPTEFKYNSKIIPDSISIPWPESGYCSWWFDNRPGIFDDLYMDLTFVQVFEDYGIDTPIDSFAQAFANAPYPLWHGNQAARYNILTGNMPPQSGFWKSNPHSDDIDFQIEADHIGLMTPGMPVTASEIADKIGHLMAYGDGWYGGVYVASMYSIAFITSDINIIVNEALKSIPKESDFYKCMNDVIGWCAKNADWKQTWQELENKWGNDISCPDGYLLPFNIEAKMNSAYVIMGLLYGNGDFATTLDVSTRTGADSDCNPSTAAGILGTALGYSKISEKWLNNVKEVEDRIFPYTKLSLNNTYNLSYKHALEVIKRNGGKESRNDVTINPQKPIPSKLEISFEGIKPHKREEIKQSLTSQGFKYKFKGCGILIGGGVRMPRNMGNELNDSYVADIEVLIDGKSVESLKLPSNSHNRKLEVYWNFDLSDGSHDIELKLKNPDVKSIVNLNYAISYSK